MKKFLLIFTLVFSTFLSKAQSFILTHDHSTIQVKDIDKSVKFYKEILHLKEIPTPWPENKMIRFFETGKNLQLHIGQVDVEEYGEVKVNKVLHIAFAINDFDGYLSFLDKQGIDYMSFAEEHKKVQTRPDGVRQIYFKDPDGYWIEINDAKH